MTEIPFLNPSNLKEWDLPVPNRDTALQQIPLLDLSNKPAETLDILGYRKLYGMDLLACTQWQGYINTSAFKIFVQVFKPLQPPIGTVGLLHGYLEHSGIYQPLIDEILAQGFSVVTFDLPGHGLSEGSPANIQNFDDYQQVLNEVYQTVQGAIQLPKPWLGIGQSTGAAIWIHHLLEHAEQRKAPMIDRALLLSPLIRPAKSAWWHNTVGLGIVKRIKRQVPRHFRRNNHNPEFLRFIRLKDPLQPRMMGMDWILAMSKWMQEIEQRPTCRIPVWLAQGALDQTVDWRYNIEFIRRKFRLQNLLLLEEASHQLVNERSDIRSALTGLIPVFLHVKPKQPYYE